MLTIETNMITNNSYSNYINNYDKDNNCIKYNSKKIYNK